MNLDFIVDNYSSLEDEQKKYYLKNSNFKKLLLAGDDYYKFARFLYLLSNDEMSIFFDDEAINLLVSYGNVSKKLSFILERDCSNLDFLCNDKMMSAINKNYESVKYLLNGVSYKFISSYFNYLINNDIDNFIRISSCGSLVGKFLSNDEVISIIASKNLITSNSILKFNSFTISCLIRKPYFKNMILSDDFDLYDLLFKNVIFDDSLLLDDVFINKLVDENDIAKYRFMINQMSSGHNISLIDSIEEKRNAYYDKYIDEYLPEVNMFSDYYDLYTRMTLNGHLIDQNEFFDFDFKQVLSMDEKYDLEKVFFSKCDDKISKIKDLFSLKSSRKFLEVLIDRYYKDIDINFLSDLDNVVKFNNKVNILGFDSKNRYDRIIELKDSCSVDIDFYKSFKKSDYTSIFYDDVNMLQNYSYRCMVDKLVDASSIKVSKTKEKGIDVYNYEGEDFYFLVHSFNPSTYRNINDAFSSNFNKSVTSLSLINNNVLGHYGGRENVIIGFDNIDISRIVHVFNRDSFSRERSGEIFSERINKLYLPDDLMNDTVGYNEIVYYNYSDNYNGLTPSYVICFDSIRDVDISVASKFNIPIMKINTLKYPKQKRYRIGMLNTDEKYVFSYESYEEKKKNCR